MKSNKNGKSYIPNIKVPCKQQGGAIKPNSTVHITRCSRKEMEDLPRDPEKANMKEICRVTTLLRPHQERNSHAIFLSHSLGIWYLTPSAFIVVNWSRKHKVKAILAKNNTEKKNNSRNWEQNGYIEWLSCVFVFASIEGQSDVMFLPFWKKNNLINALERIFEAYGMRRWLARTLTYWRFESWHAENLTYWQWWYFYMSTSWKVDMLI